MPDVKCDNTVEPETSTSLSRQLVHAVYRAKSAASKVPDDQAKRLLRRMEVIEGAGNCVIEKAEYWEAMRKAPFLRYVVKGKLLRYQKRVQAAVTTLDEVAASLISSANR